MTELKTTWQNGEPFEAGDLNEIAAAVNGLAAGLANTPAGYSATIGNGATSEFVVEHGMNTTDVVVGVWETATGVEVNCDKARTSPDSVTLTFGSPPGVGQYRVLILSGGFGVSPPPADFQQVPDWSVVTMSAAGTLAASPGMTYVVMLEEGAAPRLPAAPGNTSRYVLKNVSGGVVTVQTTSSQMVEGEASLAIGAGASVEVVAHGADWRII